MNNIEYSGSRSQWNAIFTDSGLQNVPVAPGSIDVTVTSGIRTVTAKVDGSSVPINDGKFIVTIGKTVELTVGDPQYRDRYTWAGGSGTVSADNTTYTFVAGQDDTAVTLTTVEHTNYDTGDFTISGLADYSYRDNIDIRIEPKDTRITDYIVRYVRNAGTSNEEEFNELPKMPEHTPCESFRVIPSESTFRKRSQSTPLPSPMILSRTNSLSPFQRMLWKRKAMIILPQ